MIAVDLPFLNSLILLLASAVLVFLTARYWANRNRIIDLEQRVTDIEAHMEALGK